MKAFKVILLLALLGLAAAAEPAKDAKAADAAEAKEEPPAPTGASKTTVYAPKGLPKTVPATSKYEYNVQSGVGAFQVWTGGLEIPKVINLGGSRTTREGLRG